MKPLKGARPIIDLECSNHYTNHIFKKYTVKEYANIFYNWINNSKDKTILGLDKFTNQHYTQGTSQTFDNFVMRNSQRQIVNFLGDFQYHACIARHCDHKIITDVNELHNGQSLIISLPFSDTGQQHNEFDQIIQRCNQLDIPVCLDIAYWGIAKNIDIDLDQCPCIKEVTCSLSKPFANLEKHRIGIRFCRDYTNDGICMINEVNMFNDWSISLGIWFMNKFSNSFNWEKYSEKYIKTIEQLELQSTNTVIFGVSKDKYREFNRGLPNNNRVCISEFLQK